MSGSQSKALKFNQYTYNRQIICENNFRRWYCMRYHTGCTATVVTNSELTVVEYNGYHCHKPPIYLRYVDSKN